MKRKLMNKKGLSQFVTLAMGFGIGIVGFVIVVILLGSILTGSSNGQCGTSTHIYNITTGTCNNPANVSQTSVPTVAGNVTVQSLVFANNFSQQWGLSGTILGYVLVLAILALIGVGGFMAYKHVKGSR